MWKQVKLREPVARQVDLAEPDVFEFGGDQCDGLVASVFVRARLQT